MAWVVADGPILPPAEAQLLRRWRRRLNVSPLKAQTNLADDPSGTGALKRLVPHVRPCDHHDVMTSSGLVRSATIDDGPRMLFLWAALFDEGDDARNEPWRTHASHWFDRFVNDSATARFPVIEDGGEIVAAAIGTLEIGVPNPYCPRGRVVRLANVVTLPEHRGHGHGTALVLDVINWAKGIDADRVDLSSTPEGQRIYENVGFTPTSAPRMKFVL